MGARVKALKPTESEVLRACLDYLRARGILAWRNNTGAMSATYKGKTRFIRFSEPGIADILGVLPGGRLLAVECKRPGGKLSELQAAFLARVRDAGGLAVCVDDVRFLERVVEGCL